MFGANTESREIARRASSSGWEQCRLAIVSNRSDFLELPWELINHEDFGYLVNRMSGTVRRNTSGSLPALDVELPADEYNVLLVAPLNGSGFGIAAESLSAMESLAVPVGLTCLRPASFQAFRDHLAERPGHYHLVHCDGFDVDAEGLVFSGGDGPAERTTVAELARVLTAARAPVTLLTNSASGRGAGAGGGLCVRGTALHRVSSAPLGWRRPPVVRPSLLRFSGRRLRCRWSGSLRP